MSLGSWCWCWRWSRSLRAAGGLLGLLSFLVFVIFKGIALGFFEDFGALLGNYLFSPW
jgi:hypothetical protein